MDIAAGDKHRSRVPVPGLAILHNFEGLIPDKKVGCTADSWLHSSACLWIGGFESANMSVRSPRNLCISIIQINTCRIGTSQKHLIYEGSVYSRRLVPSKCVPL